MLDFYPVAWGFLSINLVVVNGLNLWKFVGPISVVGVYRHVEPSWATPGAGSYYCRRVESKEDAWQMTFQRRTFDDF